MHETKKMKVSLVTTCLNESNNIKKFLDSVVRQTRKPDEFIITDAGSTDGTVDIIKEFQKRHRWIRLIVANNISRGDGKNLAIEKAENEIIATTDAGCFLDKNWLKNIVKPFKNGADFVAGYYKPFHRNDFEFFEGLILVHPRIDKLHLISSRSSAFKKSLWKSVNGYSGKVFGEDLHFHLKISNKNAKIVFADNAITYWDMPESIKSLFKKFSDYGAGYWEIHENKKFGFMIAGVYSMFGVLFASLFLSIKLTFLLIALMFAFFLCYGIKGVFRTKRYDAILYLPLIFLVKNLAFVSGFTFGKRKKYE